jgi:hypothetical protein
MRVGWRPKEVLVDNRKLTFIGWEDRGLFSERKSWGSVQEAVDLQHFVNR